MAKLSNKPLPGRLTNRRKQKVRSRYLPGSKKGAPGMHLPGVSTGRWQLLGSAIEGRAVRSIGQKKAFDNEKATKTSVRTSRRPPKNRVSSKPRKNRK